MNPDTVTHLSINRARRRLTSLIEANALPLRQTTTRTNIGLYGINAWNDDGVCLWCNKTSLNQEKSEFDKTVEKHELEMIAKRQQLHQMQEDIERQKVNVYCEWI